MKDPKRTAEFLTKLADLCEHYRASFFYTNRDDGIHFLMDEEEVLVSDGFYAPDFVKDLRAGADRLIQADSANSHV